MKNPWRFFLVVEALLLLFAIWQIVSNPPLLILFIFGIFCIYLAVKTKNKTKFRNFQMVIGCIAIFITLLNNPALWLMVIFAILFIGLKGVEISGVDLTKNAFWRKKEMIIVETDEPAQHQKKIVKQQWFGDQRIGSQVYEWDDINLDVVSGDTIIDLGNTILPKKESFVIIRKGIGKTRILVPSGIGIKLEHSTFFGTVTFDGAITSLKNEKLTILSDDYDENPRRLKLLTNTLFGDIEVIRV